MDREPGLMVDRRATAAPTLLIERGLRRPIRAQVKRNYRSLEPRELRKKAARDARERADALIGGDGEVTLDELPPRSTQVEVLAPQQDLLPAELVVGQAVHARHDDFTPARRRRRWSADGTRVLGPMYRCFGSNVNAGAATTGAASS